MSRHFLPVYSEEKLEKFSLMSNVSKEYLAKLTYKYFFHILYIDNLWFTKIAMHRKNEIGEIKLVINFDSPPLKSEDTVKYQYNDIKQVFGPHEIDAFEMAEDNEEKMTKAVNEWIESLNNVI